MSLNSLGLNKPEDALPVNSSVEASGAQVTLPQWHSGLGELAVVGSPADHVSKAFYLPLQHVPTKLRGPQLR